MKHSLLSSWRLLLAGIVLSGFFSACSVLDPAEEIPSYLHIDAFNLSANLQTQGSSTSKITDAWIYMDGQLIGAFQLPCTVPILNEGTHHFIIRGGVKMNGLSATRAIYPFWKGWEGDVTLTRSQVKSIGTQTLNYFPGVSMDWIADFESVGINFAADQTVTSAKVYKAAAPNAYEGLYSGYVYLNADTTIFIGVSSTAFSLPPTSDVYLEFDYRCNNDFTVGIQGPDGVNVDSHAALVVTPSINWNKIYIRLTDVLADNNPAGTIPFKIYFAMQQDAGNSQPYLYLDNIKLLK
jgi:hypothetical protein